MYGSLTCMVLLYVTIFCIHQMPVAAQPKTWLCCLSLAGIAGSNPTEDMDVCHGCFVLSSRGLCFGLITRPEEFYRVCCV
jgi:hypothetical protein